MCNNSPAEGNCSENGLRSNSSLSHARLSCVFEFYTELYDGACCAAASERDIVVHEKYGERRQKQQQCTRIVVQQRMEGENAWFPSSRKMLYPSVKYRV